MGLLQARTGKAQPDTWRRGWRRGRLPNHRFPFVGELSLIPCLPILPSGTFPTVR